MLFIMSNDAIFVIHVPFCGMFEKLSKQSKTFANVISSYPLSFHTVPSLQTYFKVFMHGAVHRAL